MQALFPVSFERFLTLSISILWATTWALHICDGLHMLTGDRTKHYENIATSLNLTVFMCWSHEGMQSACYAIYYANFYCVFRSNLTGLPRRSGQLCRSRWQFRGFSGDVFVLLDPQKCHAHFSLGGRPKESLCALWLRNNVVKAQKCLSIEWSPPAVRRQQEQAPWRLWEQTSKASRIYHGHGTDFRTTLNCSWLAPNRVRPKSCGESGASPQAEWSLDARRGAARLYLASLKLERKMGTVRSPVSDTCWRWKSLGTLPGDSRGWNWTRAFIELWWVRNENKDPSYSRCLFFISFLRNISIV